MTVLICFIPWQQLWEMDNRLSPPKHTAETNRRPKTTTAWSTSGGPADARKTDTMRKRWNLLWEQRETLVSLFSRQMNKKYKYTLILRPQNMCWHGQNQRSPPPQNHPENTCPLWRATHHINPFSPLGRGMTVSWVSCQACLTSCRNCQVWI